MKSFLEDESGQAITEYILILSVAVTVAGAITRTLIGVLDRGMLNFGAQLERDLKTGRTSLSAWKN